MAHAVGPFQAPMLSAGPVSVDNASVLHSGGCVVCSAAMKTQPTPYDKFHEMILVYLSDRKHHKLAEVGNYFMRGVGIHTQEASLACWLKCMDLIFAKYVEYSTKPNPNESEYPLIDELWITDAGFGVLDTVRS